MTMHTNTALIRKPHDILHEPNGAQALYLFHSDIPLSGACT